MSYCPECKQPLTSHTGHYRWCDTCDYTTKVNVNDDHVSKRELKEWCESRIAFMNTHKENYGVSAYLPYKLILDKFCGGE